MQQQVVEVHRVGAAQRAHGLRVHAADVLVPRVERRSGVLLGREHRVLGAGDLVPQAAYRVELRRQAEILDDPADQRLTVVFVVDGELAREAEQRRLPPQDTHAHAVERADPQSVRFPAEQRRHPAAHLAGRLVGERDGEDALRADAVIGDEARQSGGEHARLARTSAGEHQHRAVDVRDGCVLRLVERQVHAASRLMPSGRGAAGSRSAPPRSPAPAQCGRRGSPRRCAW